MVFFVNVLAKSDQNIHQMASFFQDFLDEACTEVFPSPPLPPPQQSSLLLHDIQIYTPDEIKILMPHPSPNPLL